MRIGQIVTINSDFPKDSKGKKCFVEEVICKTGDFRNKPNEQQVSLYGLDGEYYGDYWTDELEITQEIVPEILLQGFIRTFALDNKKGLVKDFAKVLTNLNKEVDN